MSAQLQLVRPGAGSRQDGSHVQQLRSGRVYATRPSSSPLLTKALGHVDWSDAYAVTIPSGEGPRDPQEWADAVFRAPPSPLVRALFGARQLTVRLVGIEVGGRHVFDTVSRSEHEVLLGADQGHLAFRVLVAVETDRVVLSTVVRLRNRRGRAYFALVRRLHPMVVCSMLARAARNMTASS
jgi:hypothetical protein